MPPVDTFEFLGLIMGGNRRPSNLFQSLLAQILQLRYIDADPLLRMIDVCFANNTMKNLRLVLVTLFIGAAGSALAGTAAEIQPSPTPEDENSHDIFSVESNYTLDSDFHQSHLGNGDSLYDDFSYDHRFLITGKWYFRTGVEYERFDFDGTNNGLPDHLQALYGHLAFEYVAHDYTAAGIELDPGTYFQDSITRNTFDIPWKIFVSFPLKKDKIFGVIGLGGGLYQDPPVAPGGGLIWLFNDKLRLEGVFPKPALVYDPTEDLQLRLLGQISYDSFRTDDVVTPERRLQLHNAIVQYSEIRGGAQVSYTGFKPFRLIAGAGYTFRREFDFFRANQRVVADPAPYFKLGIEMKF
jgi:hypothetical protein